MILQILLHLFNGHTLSRKSQTILVNRVFHKIYCLHVRNRKCNKLYIYIKSVFINLFICFPEKLRLHSRGMHIYDGLTNNLLKLVELVILDFFKRIFLSLFRQPCRMVDPGIIRCNDISINFF